MSATKENAPTAVTVEASKAETPQPSKESTMNSTGINTSAQLTPSLTVENGQVTTTSLQVAEHFGKVHRDVVRAIENIECSNEFRLRNFAQSSFEAEMPKGGKRKHKAYRITRDGFVFLAMGFTGKEAAQWKEAYITAFNRMERELNGKTQKTALPAPTGTERMLITKNLATGETTVENLGTQALLFKTPDHMAHAVMHCRLGVEVTQKIAQHAMMGMVANAVDLKKQIRSQAVTETLNQMASLPVADLVELSTSAHTFLSGMALKTAPKPAAKGDRLLDAALAASVHA